MARPRKRKGTEIGDMSVEEIIDSKDIIRERVDRMQSYEGLPGEGDTILSISNTRSNSRKRYHIEICSSLESAIRNMPDNPYLIEWDLDLASGWGFKCCKVCLHKVYSDGQITEEEYEEAVNE